MQKEGNRTTMQQTVGPDQSTHFCSLHAELLQKKRFDVIAVQFNSNVIVEYDSSKNLTADTIRDRRSQNATVTKLCIDVSVQSSRLTMPLNGV